SSLDLPQPSRDNSSNAPLSGSRISARNSPAARAFLNFISAAPRAASLALKASTNGLVASPSFPAAGGLAIGSLMAASNPCQLGGHRLIVEIKSLGESDVTHWNRIIGANQSRHFSNPSWV